MHSRVHRHTFIHIIKLANILLRIIAYYGRVIVQPLKNSLHIVIFYIEAIDAFQESFTRMTSCKESCITFNQYDEVGAIFPMESIILQVADVLEINDSR